MSAASLQGEPCIDEAFRYVYLCSAPHSGSTLIACLLDGHPSIMTVGEFGAEVPSTALCSCGVKYTDCDFWKSWGTLAAAEGIEFIPGALGINLEPKPGDGRLSDLYYHLFPWRCMDQLRNSLYPPTSRWKRQSQAAIDKAVRLARMLCKHHQSNVFFDTMKNPLQIPFLAKHAGIRLKLIALVRDGRGVMNSLIKKERWSPDQAIDTWIWANRNLRRAARYLPRRDVFWLRLEDLCQHPQSTLQSLMNFCEVTPVQALEFQEPRVRHIVGNGMRLSFSGKIRSDEQWRHELQDAHLSLFETRAGRFNRSFGYQ